MHHEQDMPMLGEDVNKSDNFGSYENEKSTPKAQDIEEDHRNLVGKSSDTRSRAKTGRTLQNGLLGSESLSSLREIRFSE